MCRARRLDDLEHDLVIEAERLAGDGARVLYSFALFAGNRRSTSRKCRRGLEAGREGDEARARHRRQRRDRRGDLPAAGRRRARASRCMRTAILPTPSVWRRLSAPRAGRRRRLLSTLRTMRTDIQRARASARRRAGADRGEQRGIHADAPMAGMSGEQWRSVVDVSLHGFFNVTRPLLLPMIGTRWGRIISLSSVAALRGNRGQANYAAAKAGCTAPRARSRSSSPRAASRSTRSPPASSPRR